MKRRLAAALCVAGLMASVGVLRASTPSSGTLTPGATTQWSGTAGIAATPSGVAVGGEDLCVDGTNCDVYTLKIPAGSSLANATAFTSAFGTNELASTYSGIFEPSALRSEQ